MIKLSSLKFKLSNSKFLFLLIQDQHNFLEEKINDNNNKHINDKICFVITHACIIQIKNNCLYIEALDTTGYFKPRNLQSYFTKRFIKSILKEFDPKIISVFSKPKKEFIFNLSHKNPLKRILKPRDLFNYWLSLFESIQKYGLKNDNKYKLFVCSPFHKNKSVPFKSLDDVVFFEDDPKRKLLNSLRIDDARTVMEDSNMIDIDLFYILLLQRYDMNKGGLLYLKVIYQDENYKKLNHEILTISVNNEDPIDFLRNSNFGNYKDSLKFSTEFLKKFVNFQEKLIFENFDEKLISKEFDKKDKNLKSEDFIFLTTKRKKK
ncbi:Histone acetyltransferase [Dictyocoela muelleri]|nr:Histone acetyltransferase [Dictyocoela muelleri]